MTEAMQRGAEVWHGSVCGVEGMFLQDCCLPVRGEVGPHEIDLQAIATAGCVFHWLHIFLKNTSAPSVGESPLTGRRNYLVNFLGFCSNGGWLFSPLCL